MVTIQHNGPGFLTDLTDADLEQFASDASAVMIGIYI